jgi:hypothetical protein
VEPSPNTNRTTQQGPNGAAVVCSVVGFIYEGCGLGLMLLALISTEELTQSIPGGFSTTKTNMDSKFHTKEGTILDQSQEVSSFCYENEGGVSLYPVCGVLFNPLHLFVL